VPVTKHTPSTTTTAPTTTTSPVKPVSGPETVLSPIGLHVRAGPSTAAAILGTAAQGTVFHLLGRTAKHGGWLKVLGATVTGWISANRAFSAPGRFSAYRSTPFDVLYPAGWTAGGTPSAGVTFAAPGGAERVVLRTAPSRAALGISVAGAVVSSARQVVACGYTAYLYRYASSAAGQHLATLVLDLAPGHFLGLKAVLSSPAQIATVMDFVHSVSFPYPQCVGGLPPAQHPHTPTSAPHTPTSAPHTHSSTARAPAPTAPSPAHTSSTVHTTTAHPPAA
jgi:hypothetical protein